jgi:two-component system chemotaxis response regulator CheB
VRSGGGHDAATGATAVHRFGGMVIAASPHSAEHASMPRATIDRDTITDHVTAVDEVPALLTALLTTPTIHPAAD